MFLLLDFCISRCFFIRLGCVHNNNNNNVNISKKEKETQKQEPLLLLLLFLVDMNRMTEGDDQTVNILLFMHVFVRPRSDALKCVYS